jgi:hypothetical protein
MLDQGTATWTSEKGFREGEVVLRLVEEDGFVENWVGQGVQAPVD